MNTPLVILPDPRIVGPAMGQRRIHALQAYRGVWNDHLGVIEKSVDPTHSDYTSAGRTPVIMRSASEVQAPSK